MRDHAMVKLARFNIASPKVGSEVNVFDPNDSNNQLGIRIRSKNPSGFKLTVN